jgi:hypothetical protein
VHEKGVGDDPAADGPVRVAVIEKADWKTNLLVVAFGNLADPLVGPFPPWGRRIFVDGVVKATFLVLFAALVTDVAAAGAVANLGVNPTAAVFV